MKNPTLALSWAYWRRGLPALPCAVAGVLLAFGSLVLLALAGGVSERVVAGFDIYVFAITSPIYVCVVFSAIGEQKSTYSLPVSSRQLVITALANGALMMLGSVSLTVVFFNLLLDAGWAFWRPAMDSVLVLIWCYALTVAIPWESIRAGIVWIVAALFGASHVAYMSWALTQAGGASEFGDLSHTWEQVTPLQLAITIAAGLVGLLLANQATHRIRRGDSILQPVARGLQLAADSLQWSLPHQRTGPSAERWKEWSEKGIVLPALTAVAGIVLVIWFSTSLVNGQQAIDVVPAFTLMLLGANFLLGGFMGQCGGSFKITTFKATRPLSDTQLADGILSNVACSVGLTWTLWFPLVVLAIIAFRLTGQPIPGYAHPIFGGAGVASAVVPLLTTYGITLLLGWTLASLGAAMYLIPRWVFSTIFVGGINVPVWSGFLAMAVLPRDVAVPILNSLVWIVAGATIIGFVGIVVGALVLGLISWKRCLLAALLNIAGAGALAVSMSSLPAEMRPELIEVGSLRGLGLILCCTAPGAALAAIPLAVWSTRHR